MGCWSPPSTTGVIKHLTLEFPAPASRASWQTTAGNIAPALQPQTAVQPSNNRQAFRIFGHHIGPRAKASSACGGEGRFRRMAVIGGP